MASLPQTFTVYRQIMSVYMCAETHDVCAQCSLAPHISCLPPDCLHASTVTMIVAVRWWVYVYTNTRACAPDECVLSDGCDERRLT